MADDFASAGISRATATADSTQTAARPVSQSLVPQAFNVYLGAEPLNFLAGIVSGMRMFAARLRGPRALKEAVALRPEPAAKVLFPSHLSALVAGLGVLGAVSVAGPPAQRNRQTSAAARYAV